MFNISYEATLVAGQIGFSLHEESTPVVEPFAGWAMLTTQDTHTAVRNHIQVRGSPGSGLGALLQKFVQKYFIQSFYL